MQSFLRFLILFPLCGLLSCAGGTESDNHTDVAINTPAEVKQAAAAELDSYDASFADGMTEKVFQNYLHLRDALVASDAAEAARVSGFMAAAFGPDHAEAKRRAQAIHQAGDIEVQRAEFTQLTAAVGPLFEQGLSGGTIYKQYCPMAFDNTGADWYSDSEKILNPYFGDRMLRCGKVTQVIQ